MICRFNLRPLGRIAAGMASQTLACRSGVTHDCRCKGCEVFVTGIALDSRRNMPGSGRLGLGVLRNVCAAVTGGTLTRCASVVHLRWSKCSVILVAGIALRCRRNVRAGLAKSGRIVVAIRTCTDSRCSVSKRSTTPDRR